MCLSRTFNILILLVVVSFVTHATDVNFINSCDYQIQVIKTLNFQQPVEECSLSQGDSCTRSYNNVAGNFKNGWGGKTLAEFSFNQNMNMDFYDLSVIVGYDTPMQISSNFLFGVKTVTCTEPRCPDAYLYPKDDRKTHGTATGKTFTVTFCP